MSAGFLWGRVALLYGPWEPTFAEHRRGLHAGVGCCWDWLWVRVIVLCSLRKCVARVVFRGCVLWWA